MPDGFAGQLQDGASADAPANPLSDIDAITAKLQADFEERVKGFQRMVSERDRALDALRDEIEESRLAGLSEDEREALLIEKKDRTIEELQRKLELQELSRDYGTEMPYFQRLIDAESTEQQLQVMREFAQTLAAAQAPAPAPEPEPEVPEIDLNRPMRRFDGIARLPDGSVLTEAEADRILGSVTRQADITQRALRQG